MSRRAGVIGAVLAAVLLAAFAVWQVSRARCFVLVGDAICRIETTQPIVALTFDDGPTDLGVRTVLPLLAKHRAHATFFLVGEFIADRPDLARQILAAGDEIGNHSYTHQRMIGRSPAFYEDEITRTDAAIRAVGGKPGLFRPPYGKKLVGLPWVVSRRGAALVMAEVADPETSDPADFARQVVAQARPGSIIGLHPMFAANAVARRALPAILDGLTAKGLRPVSVGELMRARRAH